MEKKRHVDFLTALCVGGIGLYAVLESRNISAKYYARPQHGNDLTSPALTPTLLGVALIFCALILLVRSVRGYGMGKLASDIGAAAVRFAKSRLVWFSAVGLLVMGLYIYGMLDLLSFAIASFVFLLVMMGMLRAAKWWQILIISLVTVAATLILFQVIFHIRLP